MKYFIFSLLLGMATGTCFAETWTGKLLDANCVKQQMAQKTPEGSQENAATACPAGASTKTFAVEVAGGEIYRLNSAGNTKAAEAMRNAKPGANVTINGTRHGKTIDVEAVDVQ